LRYEKEIILLSYAEEAPSARQIDLRLKMKDSASHIVASGGTHPHPNPLSSMEREMINHLSCL